MYSPSPCSPGQMEEGHPTGGNHKHGRAENICNRNIWGLKNSLKEKIKSFVLVCLILIDCLASSVIHHGLVSHPWMTKQQTRVNNQCIKKPYFHFYNATTVLSLSLFLDQGSLFSCCLSIPCGIFLFVLTVNRWKIFLKIGNCETLKFETELEEEELQIGGNCQINPGQCSAARHPILSTMHLPPPLLGSPCFSNPKFALRPPLVTVFGNSLFWNCS